MSCLHVKTYQPQYCMSGAALARFSRTGDVTRNPTRFWPRDKTIRTGFPDFEDTSPNPHSLSACRDSTRQRSGGVQAGGDGAEQVLMRTGAGEHQADAARVAQLHRADPQQGQPDPVRAGGGKRRVRQRQAAQFLDQGVGQSREQLPGQSKDFEPAKSVLEDYQFASSRHSAKAAARYCLKTRRWLRLRWWLKRL